MQICFVCIHGQNHGKLLSILQKLLCCLCVCVCVFLKLYCQPLPDLYLGDVKLEESSKHKQLGAVFNINDVTFEITLTSSTKAMTGLTVLMCIKYKLQRQSHLTTYLSSIRPLLQYG